MERGAIARWASAARKAALSELESLRDQRNRARQIRAHVDELIYVADNRLALPRSGPMRFPVRVARNGHCVRVCGGGR